MAGWLSCAGMNRERGIGPGREGRLAILIYVFYSLFYHRT